MLTHSTDSFLCKSFSRNSEKLVGTCGHIPSFPSSFLFFCFRDVQSLSNTTPLMKNKTNIPPIFLLIGGKGIGCMTPS
ncbi:hypothetical protein HanIR_Chr13g0625231 [Helianthus annuus]|nr:hypothetical protein HanIR_Chr13g0625231 [Helianthus annuus]